MSASNVSITAANPRRRNTSISDVKTSIDFANDNNATPTAANDSLAAAGDPTPVTNNKDLSHSIRGEAVLERSSKETGPSKPAPKPRARKTPNPASTTSSKHAKPRWKTVLSVILKNLLLLLVLVGLVQMVRRIAVKSAGEGSIAAGMLGFEDMEGKIAAVEKTVKTTAKMLQVQVEVVDKKIETEVRNLRGEIGKRVDERAAEIEATVRRLSEKSEALERGVEEVVRMYEEMIKAGKAGGGAGVSVVGLDEVRAVAREVVERQIEKHAADGLGKVDYALASGGARVEKHSEVLVVGKAGGWLSGGRHGVDDSAVKMLSPSFGEPGMCFALKGSSGFVQIQLRTSIVPEAITLEHVAKSVAYDRSSAPKSCRVYGWLQWQQGLETDLNAHSEMAVLLAEFTYDLEKSNAQTINVLDSARSAVINTVRFEFMSNHGSPTHTCIYRLRVHGHESSSVLRIAGDS